MGMKYAVTIGYIGPVLAVSNMNVVLQIILDVIFEHQIPNNIELFSAAIGILGTCVIAFYK